MIATTPAARPADEDELFQMSASDTAVVAVRQVPRLMAGQLDQQDFLTVSDWVTRNTDARVAYSDGQIDTIQLGQALKRAP